MWIAKKYQKLLKTPFIAAAILAVPLQALAQDSPFSPGWILDAEESVLRFQSIKSATKVESSSFATFTGTIDESGLATIRIGLDSVDTKVDLRNVRMRFLLFETFEHPEAVITMQIDPATLTDLGDLQRKVVTMPYTISLHGIESAREAEITMTLLNDNRVLVTSGIPISLPTADFNLDGGVEKLQDAAKVVIIPSATVTFDFIFDRSVSAEYYTATAAEMNETAGLGSAALETEGDFSLAACEGRFEVMSRADNIYFATSSSRLEDRSGPFLDSIADIVQRCPDLSIRIAGHTDTDGGAGVNQNLSEARATSVLTYLIDAGVDERRMRAVGFGETEPVAPNDTEENKQRNRRIEFTVFEPTE